MANNWNAILNNTNNLTDVLAILKKVLALLEVKADVTTIDEALVLIEQLNIDINSTVDDVDTALNKLEIEADEVIAQGFYKSYATEALLLAARPTVSEMRARADDTRKIWRWTGAAPWVDTGLSDFEQAKLYVDNKTEIIQKIELSKTETNPTVIPILVDESNKTLIGYNTEKDQIEAGGLQEQVLENFPNLMQSNDIKKVAVLTDANNKILIGYDTENDKAILAGLELPNQKPKISAINHLLFYGQSLGVGATATTILSASQPYFNKTFNTGPRKDSAADFVIPLVEQFNNPASDAGTNRGETCCSGAANYASRAMMLENGIKPQNHMIFASAAGHGGYRIDQLEKGTAWYDFFISHVVEAKRLNGVDYKVQVVCWVQGENDAVTSLQTSYEIYKQKLKQLQKDASSDIKAITGQTDEVKFVTYQMSYAAKTWEKQALVQLHLCQEHDNFLMATPIYHMPYASDFVHLTNVGYKWMGAYFGRAYKQLIIDNRKPDFINPRSAKIINDEIHIKFDVPKLPLVLDTATLPVTASHGFKVIGDNVALTLSSITTDNDTVILKLAAIPTTDIQVRYALDYLGAGINLTGGASGNLRDSTTDSIKINHVEKPLYHVCPHFQLTAFLDKGI